jgi:hypothetical protein
MRKRLRTVTQLKKTAIARRYALYRTDNHATMNYAVRIEQENGMEAFFMMTAMITLLGPIALGRVRCIGIAARLPELDLVKSMLANVSASATLAAAAT